MEAVMRDRYLITGGAGFIGTNLAEHYLEQNKHVTILDNFSRAGAKENMRYLQERYEKKEFTVIRGDIRDTNLDIRELACHSDVIFHLAAQVAVTTSVKDPWTDFEINALGTLRILEAVRRSSDMPIFIYSSTNKVYGKLSDLASVEKDSRYDYLNMPDGIPETRTLDFYSPYGCSKGAADQYAIDYARIYGVPTVVFRQSCIYGPHQFGIEDQGWVAWFAIRALQDLPVVIYGDGKQVRDVLYIDDLMAAFDLAIAAISKTKGQAFNIGGGPQNTLSILELLQLLEQHFGRKIKCSFSEWRPGDQLAYISSIKKAERHFGWEPRVSPAAGLSKLLDWLKQNKHLFPR
jgi:CDP-paratose 2-epimerase